MERKVTRVQHVQNMESLRESWIPRVKAIVARQLKPVRDAHPASQPHVMRADRDAWIQAISKAEQMVGMAFATHTLPLLAQQAKIDASDDAHYGLAIERFIGTYARNQVPGYVDHVLTSFAAKHSDLASSTPKAAMVLRSGAAAHSPKPSTKDSSIADEEDLGLDDWDMLLDSVEDVVSEMVTVLSSNLGPMASAAAFADVNDLELEKVWQSVNDAKTRPAHAEADGQHQALDQPFEVGDSEMLFPMDQSLGAGIGDIIYCRCVVWFDIAASSKERLRKLTWADRMADIVVMNLPGVLGEGGTHA